MTEGWEFEFDADKNRALKWERGISFDEIILLIHEGHLLDVVDHPNQRKYPDQRLYMVDVGGYVYLVPFVTEKNRIILKTIYPSRKATKDYRTRKEES